MKISACYIVKNEEKTLPFSLESLHKAVDEIVVVDTGSTDKTVQKAKKYGARIFPFFWQNDFSAPRNFAIDKANGDWIVFLDADEYFTLDTADNLRSVIRNYHETGRRGCLLIHRYDIDKDNHNQVLADTLMARVFFKNSSYRYEGIIHEELTENGKPITALYIVPQHELKILHTGYSGSLSQAKAERNLNLLLKELASSDNPGRLYMYLADAYLGLGNKEKAKYYAKLDVAQGRRPTTYASRSYRILLQLSLENGDDCRKRLRLCQAAVRDYPENPEFRADLAECFAVLRNYPQAVAEMELALKNFREYQGIEPMLFTPTQAEIAQRRMEGWRKKMSAVDLTEIAELLRMLLLPLLLMKDSEYGEGGTEYEKILPAGFSRVLKRYHGGQDSLDDDCAREYLDLLDMLIEQKNTDALSKLVEFNGEFSSVVRNDIVKRLDKKIAQEEFSREGEYD